MDPNYVMLCADAVELDFPPTRECSRMGMAGQQYIMEMELAMAEEFAGSSSGRAPSHGYQTITS